MDCPRQRLRSSIDYKKLTDEVTMMLLACLGHRSDVYIFCSLVQYLYYCNITSSTKVQKVHQYSFCNQLGSVLTFARYFFLLSILLRRQREELPTYYWTR